MKNLSIGSSFAWQIAANEAAAGKFQFIEKEHILIGILSLEKLVMLDPGKLGLKSQDHLVIQLEYEFIDDLLHEFEIDSTKLRRGLRDKLGKGDFENTEKIVHRSDACKDIFKHAEEFAKSSKEISCIHIFNALMENPKGIISKLIKASGAEQEDLKLRASALIDVWQKGDREPVKVHTGKQKETEKGTHYLIKYGRDLTLEAKEGKLGPFIGRRKELLNVIQTLARRSKNNPVLVGEAGVGKTAIVEALALRIAEGKDSKFLAGKRIIEINISALIGGTKYRGEFEDRLSHIIEEARAHPEVIIFIDELHNVVGAGRVEGGMDAANLMKPALARGDLRCIGATTIAEYRRYVESDQALERRFEKIIVNEPSSDETMEMLKGIRPKWEKHHGVKITDKALQAAVDLSIRFDVDHQLPDKAIDLVDKAGARTRIPLLSGWVEGIEKNTEVTEQIIAEVISEKMGLPLDIITGHIEGMKKPRLLGLESFLKNRIIGQDEAINLICQRLLISHAGLAKRRGPLAVFLFLGPTGVGKTEMARALSEFLFGNDMQLIRFDMSEFMEEHSVSKLIGSPPGYVGYDEEGQLTGQLRTKPYSVVLFDEVEKAHQKVFDLFLQLFDEGRLTDAKGRTTDARNAIFIMTSNISADKNIDKIGFGNQDNANLKAAVMEEVQKFFRTEFINRINEIIIFGSLNEDHIKRILKPMLTEISDNVKAKYNVTLKIEEDAAKFVAQMGYNIECGARELRRAVERLVQIPLSDLILSGELKQCSNWKAVCGSEGIIIIPQ
ncbi:MAG: ATP-dependent Clp protease ATP-binding subunit [Eubacteriales bacterium]|jgi:ATP-dependent Clp protease ATP-binding subunit ClpC